MCSHCFRKDLIDIDEWFEELVETTTKNKLWFFYTQKDKFTFQHYLFTCTNQLFAFSVRAFKFKNKYFLYMICFLLCMKDMGAHDNVDNTIPLTPYKQICAKHSRVTLDMIRKTEFKVFKKVQFILPSNGFHNRK